ncbi:MAG: 1,4-dihydroxy-2-naphthoate polyprenyltransferase [Desulfobacterales bacterium]|nr:1,4-dihydroxy-2-naphthoate polyprenyltransferase [Desulfobacterales bacterium]
MSTIGVWIHAIRLRTLPLSLSSILIASFAAYSDKSFQLSICIFAVITTVLLQILANLANDYGDSIHGADTEDRIGPKRAVQSGRITKNQMKLAILICALLCFIAGGCLIGVAIQTLKDILFFLMLGILAIFMAITYTAGRIPYGYYGLGDAAVFVFFGLVGVLGTYYLYVHSLPISMCLPAIANGLFSVGVLNINNMRDHQSDAKTGKHTLVVKLGYDAAKLYHSGLISIAIVLLVIYRFFLKQPSSSIVAYAFLIMSIPLIKDMVSIYRIKEPSTLDPFLKKLAINTLLTALLFGISLNH